MSQPALQELALNPNDALTGLQHYVEVGLRSAKARPELCLESQARDGRSQSQSPLQGAEIFLLPPVIEDIADESGRGMQGLHLPSGALAPQFTPAPPGEVLQPGWTQGQEEVILNRLWA